MHEPEAVRHGRIVQANHGLNRTTYFRMDGAVRVRPPPRALATSGILVYTTDQGKAGPHTEQRSRVTSGCLGRTWAVASTAFFNPSSPQSGQPPRPGKYSQVMGRVL